MGGDTSIQDMAFGIGLQLLLHYVYVQLHGAFTIHIRFSSMFLSTRYLLP